MADLARATAGCIVSALLSQLSLPDCASEGRGSRDDTITLATALRRGDGDREGAVVATATARMMFHDKSHHAKDAFWGLLATREDHRGKGLALYLGVQAMVMAVERFGARGFFAGVGADNKASNALCSRLGVGPSDFIGLACSDPGTFKRSSITR